MTLPHVIWSVLCLLIAIVWVRRFLQLGRLARDSVALHGATYDGPPNPAPRVSVVIAAKDEQATIETCIRSLLRQDYPNFEIIVANDRSADETGRILDRLAAESSGRLRVLHVSELPAGWCGKPHAVHRSIDLAGGELLIFTDADCEFTSHRALSVATRFAIENDVEFLSVIPRIKPSCFSEALLQPVCTGILMIWHRPELVNNPARPEAYANGAFIMIRRDAYQRIGGHECARNALCEDIVLARTAKSAGVRLHVIQNRDLYHTCMYDSFAAVWRGWSRIFFGSLQAPRRLLLAVVVLTIFSVVPAATFLYCAISMAVAPLEADWRMLPIAVLSGMGWLAQQGVMARFYAMVEAPRWRSLLYVPSAIVCIGILASALLRSLGWGSTTWRGTTYANGMNSNRTAHRVEKPAHAG